MEELMMKFKHFSVKEKSRKRLNKQLIPFNYYSVVYTIIIMLHSCSMAYVVLFYSWNEKHLISEVSSFVFSVTILLMMQFPTLLCLLPCIVACFCRTEVEEAQEEMKRIKSNLRRAKARAKLNEKYQQLYELASMTDVGLSTAIYVIKWPLLITIAGTAMAGVLHYEIMETDANGILETFIFYFAFAIPVVNYFPLLQYFYLAPSANKMSNLLNRAMVEVNSMDDEWLSRDPISRPYLLRMRMQDVDELRQMAVDEPPFTLFGDVLDDDVSYALILELIDMYNTLSVLEDSEEMQLTMLFLKFVQKCFDCKYWYYAAYT